MSQLSFRTGALQDRDCGYLLACDDALLEDEIAHTLVLTWNRGGALGHNVVDWNAGSACVTRSAHGREIVAVGGEGEYLALGPGGLQVGLVAEDALLRSVREIGGIAYAVGMSGVVYRCAHGSTWTRISGGLDANCDLEAIDGFNHDDLYAVGWRGGMWHFDGQRWTQIEIPTNVILTSVVCAPDGLVYCVGQTGLLVRGRGDVWEVVEHDTTEEDLWDVEFFAGRLYISTSLFVYALDPGGLKLVNFGVDRPRSCYHLSVTDGAMWSIGLKDCMMLDSSGWRRIG